MVLRQARSSNTFNPQKSYVCIPLMNEPLEVHAENHFHDIFELKRTNTKVAGGGMQCSRVYQFSMQLFRYFIFLKIKQTYTKHAGIQRNS